MGRKINNEGLYDNWIQCEVANQEKILIFVWTAIITVAEVKWLKTDFRFLYFEFYNCFTTLKFDIVFFILGKIN